MFKLTRRDLIVLSIAIMLAILPLTSLLHSASLKQKDGQGLRSFTFASGQVTCTIATTKYPLYVEAEGLAVRALSTNTGKIFIGDSTTATSVAGYELSPGESISLGGSGFYIGSGTINITSIVNGDKVCWIRLN